MRISKLWCNFCEILHGFQGFISYALLLATCSFHKLFIAWLWVFSGFHMFCKPYFWFFPAVMGLRYILLSWWRRMLFWKKRLTSLPELFWNIQDPHKLRKGSVLSVKHFLGKASESVKNGTRQNGRHVGRYWKDVRKVQEMWEDMGNIYTCVDHSDGSWNVGGVF